VVSAVSVLVAAVDLGAAAELPKLETSIVLCPLLYFKKKKLFFKDIN
jgi:hypothetical protein